MTDHKPPAGAVSDECINLAGFMRHVQEDKDPSPQDANADHVCQCLMVYSAYRQVCLSFLLFYDKCLLFFVGHDSIQEGSTRDSLPCTGLF
jgi:hypothetical protein